MKDTLVIKSIMFLASLAFLFALFLAYINYKYDSSCGQTIDALSELSD